MSRNQSLTFIAVTVQSFRITVKTSFDNLAFINQSKI